MERLDLREYWEKKLYDHVINNESLYNSAILTLEIEWPISVLWDLREQFIFTDAQEEYFINNFEE